MSRQNRSLRLTLACALALGSAAAAAQQGATGSGELEEIVVTGSQIRLPDPFAGGQVAEGGRAGILGNLLTLETPFSATSYTQELMLNQQAKSVADALLNDPNVRAARGFGNFQELFMIRGFPAYSDDMTYNGIFGILPRQFVASEFLERVELFRGPSAFLNGAAPGGSNLGGTINLVPKRAPDEPLTRLTGSYEAWKAGYVGLDMGRRFGTDGATGVRGNVAYRDGRGAIDRQDRELKVLSFGVDHRGEDLRLSADVGYQDHRIDAPRPSVTPIGGIPDTPSATTNFAQPWTYTDEEQLFGVVRAEYDVTNTVSLWAAAGMRRGEEANSLANPNALPDGSMTAYRFDNTREDDVYSGEVGVRWDFETGPIGHRLILSGSLFSLESRNAYAFSDFFNAFATNLYNPIDQPRPPADFFVGGDLNDPGKTFTTDTSSFALADMLSMFDDKLMVTLGGRYQRLENESFAYGTEALLSEYDDSEVTPVAGVVYRPTPTISIFGNYIEGLVAGDVAPTTGPNGETVVNSGQIQAPYKSEQFEAGVKYETDRIGASLNVFEITKGFGILTATTDDPATPGQDLVYREEGEQRNRGVEAGVYGEPIDNVRVIGGVTWLDAEFTETQGGVDRGNKPIGAPETQANVNVEWDPAMLQGVTLEARAMYTASQYVDGANTLEIDSWTRFDVGARYSLEANGTPVDLRFRIDNLMNDSDWISAGGFPGFGYMVLGQPRTVSLSASVEF